MCVQNLTCVPQITGVLQKIGQYLDMPTLHFLQKILMGLCADGHCEGTSHLKSVALPVPEIIAIEVLDEWELRTPVIPSVNSRPSLFSGRSLYTVKKKGFLMGFKKVFYLSSGENPKMGLL